MGSRSEKLKKYIWNLRQLPEAVVIFVYTRRLHPPPVIALTFVYDWKDMFVEAGVEEPDTWEEFEQAAKTLQECKSPLSGIK